MSQLLYNIYVYLIGVVVSIGTLFSHRAKRWKSDRKSQILDLPKNKKKVWFHVSSLGELEQAYPLISTIKNRGYYTVVSIFSHSALDYVDRYASIDHSLLLPLDTQKNALKTISNINAELVFWTKNDFWLNTINSILKTDVPIILFSSIFYESHFIGKPGFSIFRNTLSRLDHIFVQDINSKTFLGNSNIFNVTIAGDTRVSRVKQRAIASNQISGIDRFKSDKQILVLASVHINDKEIIKEAVSSFKDFYKIIIVPHDIDEKNISNIMSSIPKNVHQISDSFTNTYSDIIVLKKMGLLFDLYKSADIVYIGGGFGKGIHNILEPTVFGLSVIFGPNYSKFWEAHEFIKLQVAHCCKNAQDFNSIVSFLNLKQRSQIKADLVSFYSEYPNSVKIIMDYCLTKKLIS